jgi:hypothetical protein
MAAALVHLPGTSAEPGPADPGTFDDVPHEPPARLSGADALYAGPPSLG